VGLCLFGIRFKLYLSEIMKGHKYNSIKQFVTFSSICFKEINLAARNLSTYKILYAAKKKGKYIFTKLIILFMILKANQLSGSYKRH